MNEIVNYIELSYVFKRIITDELIIYKYYNHSIMISKKEEDKLYFIYKKKVLAVCKVSDKNSNIIIERISKIINAEIPDDDRNKLWYRMLNQLYIYDSTFNDIENISESLNKYDKVIKYNRLFFIDKEEQEIIYCIQIPIQINIKKEKEEMPTFNQKQVKTKKEKLKDIFNTVVLKESHKYKITQELLEIGCIKENGMYVFSDKIFIKVGTDNLSLSIKDTGINETFSIGAYTIDNIINYLENIYL